MAIIRNIASNFILHTDITILYKYFSGLENDEHSGSIADISSLGPGAYGQAPTDSAGVSNVPAYMERMTTDIPALKKQYAKLRQRQTQAHIILTSKSGLVSLDFYQMPL